MSNSTTAGRLEETYHAALAHDIVSLSGDECLVGVVRQPFRAFLRTVDENYPEFGPPEELLDAFERRHEDLKSRGMCDEGAHNAAWEELGFEDRYRDHLEASQVASTAVADLDARIRSGEDLVLVCFCGDGKRCHRHVLASVIEERVEQ